MFNKRKTMINGVELPEDFSVGSIINNIAISTDGKRYAAVTKSKDLVIGDMPENGKIEVDGTIITYKKSSGKGMDISANNIQMSSISGGSIICSGSSVSISGSSGLEYAIDSQYEGMKKVTLKENINDVDLSLSEDKSIYVKGHTNSKPIYTDHKLVIDGLEGRLSLPKSDSNLELDIKTSTGDVDGEVAHKGSIRTSTGDIKLHLYAPLTVETSTSVGDVKVKGMIDEGRGIYVPSNVKSIGTLILETSTGDIKVKYMLD